jgi:peptidoglycan hydrolase-like protein with peptidoglycan-binding domain
MLLQNYSSVFASAKAQGIYMHPFLQNVTTGNTTTPAQPVTTTAGTGSIYDLQRYLIAQNSGSASALLATHGATGNFGSVTKSALAEFQVRVGISPASGNYGPITRAYIATHPNGGNTTTPVVQSSGFTKTLTLGETDAQVLLLQKYLNAKGYLIATSGAGSIGSETTYFGSLTQKSLLSYQKSMNLPQTGVADTTTRASLNK